MESVPHWVHGSPNMKSMDKSSHGTTGIDNGKCRPVF